ncbi:MAG: DUF4105 domain-containing protein [Dysgonamonadaceae bacterium]|jgi:hypothetical protein|nr:DUF4105 domain-containing protein [Dysgonamonadaceae bacterium]
MKYFLVIFLLFNIFFAKAQTNYDNLQVSLLTVAPRSSEIYTIYGHTALYLYDPVLKIDTVLNWGTFNTDIPYFLFRFIAGETDYFLSASSGYVFYYLYTKENVTVTKQVLNIPNEKKEALYNMLMYNLAPENCEYRYNFLFDNCTTRPRNIIEQFCGGKLLYPEQAKKPTFRDLIHSCTKFYPWMSFGIDLIIGSGADSLLSFRQELFLPENLMRALDRATVISDNGTKYPVVTSSEIIIHSSIDEISEPEYPNSPFVTGIVILLIYLVLAVTKDAGKLICRIPFAFLFLTAGLAGCLIAFLSFISYHPCTQYNWNIVWLHPFHFLGFAGFFFKKSYFLIRWYHWINLALLLVLLLAWFLIPQQLNPANVPYMLCLGVVSAKQVIKSKKWINIGK